MKSIAIIGAGLSGLVLGSLLSKDKTYAVDIFEKSSGVGGRMATRYKDKYEFDHGVQFFKVKTKEFEDFLQPYINSGIVESWKAKYVGLMDKKIILQQIWTNDPAHYVCKPKMTSLCSSIAEDLNICLNTRITAINKNEEKWEIFTDQQQKPVGEYDLVITAIPNKQALEIIPEDINYIGKIKEINMPSSFALLLGFKESTQFLWDIAHANNPVINWISVNNSKPGRHRSPAITIISSNKFATENFDQDNNFIIEKMLTEFYAIKGKIEPIFIDLKKWKYAHCDQNLTKEQFYYDKNNHLASCGDWCISGRVESAFTSALALYKELVE